jgi:hypothetical protein
MGTKQAKPPAAASDPDTARAALAAVLGGDVLNTIERVLGQHEWAEQEVDAFREQNPPHDDRLWHSIELLRPTHERMATEFVYRAHCRELLQRVVDGNDTRPGTAPECLLVCNEIAQMTPLNTAAMGLYLRLWEKAGFPDLALDVDLDRKPFESLRGEQIDEYERDLIRKLRQPWRRLPTALTHGKGCPASKTASSPPAAKRETPAAKRDTRSRKAAAR